MENLVNRDLLINSFKNKKVFITGHTGFKGCWLLAILKKLDATVKGFALAPQYSPDLFSVLNNGSPLSQSVIHDIRDQEKLQNELINFSPDFVFHLAAQPLVRYSYENPLETFEINTIGTANLLESVRHLTKKCAVVIVTTDKVYYNKESQIPYKETDQLGGYDPYSASKAAAELVISSFRNSYFNISDITKHNKAIATARAGNIIGGGDWSKDRIIPDVISALHNNKEIVIRNPFAVRPWQHVLEPLAGYLLLAAKLYEAPQHFSGAWNFGPRPDDTVTVKDLVEKIIAVWGKGTYKIENDSMQPHETGLLKLDIQKAKSELSWSPALNIDKAIELTVNWYKQEAITNKEYTFHQIDQYFSL